MRNNAYEGTVGGYTFNMVDDTTIEVWRDSGGDFPESFICLKEGSVKNEKDFHYEIMAWYSHNVG